MDGFLTKKDRNTNHLPSNICARDRARQYAAGTFHEENGLLFCSVCNVVVDHRRKFVVDRHLKTTTHNTEALKNSSKQKTHLRKNRTFRFWAKIALFRTFGWKSHFFALLSINRTFLKKIALFFNFFSHFSRCPV